MEELQEKPIRLIRLPEVMNRTGLSRASLYHYIQDKAFPGPIKIGTRSAAWVESEVDDWIKAQIAISRCAG